MLALASSLSSLLPFCFFFPLAASFFLLPRPFRSVRGPDSAALPLAFSLHPLPFPGRSALACRRSFRFFSWVNAQEAWVQPKQCRNTATPASGSGDPIRSDLIRSEPRPACEDLLGFSLSLQEYPDMFVDEYLRMVAACARRDSAGVLTASRKLGFLTGDESKARAASAPPPLPVPPPLSAPHANFATAHASVQPLLVRSALVAAARAVLLAYSPRRFPCRCLRRSAPIAAARAACPAPHRAHCTAPPVCPSCHQMPLR